MDLLAAAKDDLTTQEALSGVFGSISLVSWIVVLVRAAILHVLLVISI